MSQEVLAELLAIPEHREWIVYEGLGDGKVLKEYLKHPLSASKKILVLDQEVTDLNALHLSEKRLSFFHGDDTEKFSIFLMNLAKDPLEIAKIQNGTFIRNLDAFLVHRKSYEKLEFILKEGLKLSTSYLGHKQDGLLGLKYVFQNTSWIEKTPGVDLLKNIFKGLPAIVASTGPSLKKSLPEIAAAQDKAVIVCPDASLKILLSAGIRPHFVCSLEREMASRPFFEKISGDDLKETHLVAYPVVPYGVISAFAGHQWMGYRTYRSQGFFETQVPRGYLMAGHSVSHMCASLADHLGCSEIILTGQDLCFDPDNLSSHSENVAYSTWSQASSEEDLRARLKEEGDDLYWGVGNESEKVPTRGYYIVFAREFSDLAKKLKAPIFNATQGGLKIDGLERADLKKKVETWKKHSLNLNEKISEARNNFKGPSTIDFSELKKALKNISGLLLQQAAVLQNLPPRDLQLGMQVVTQSRNFWEELKKDHVTEGFGFEVLGFKVARAESEWLEIKDISHISERLQKSADLMIRFFTELAECLDDVLNLTETEVPHVKK